MRLRRLLESCSPALARKAIAVWYRGSRHVCPLCGNHVRRFLPETFYPFRQDVICPVCYSQPRQRLAWLYFSGQSNLFVLPRKRFLHVAPDESLTPVFAENGTLEQHCLDLKSSRAAVHADLTNLPYADGVFDAFYCSHVLEHVPDDRKAMRELVRILKPGGYGILQVPRWHDGPTIENPDASYEERVERFKQYDHIRAYGPDFSDRLTEAGFRVEEVAPADLTSPETLQGMALADEDPLYVCRRGPPE